jgi:hypothetical protein
LGYNKRGGKMKQMLKQLKVKWDVWSLNYREYIIGFVVGFIIGAIIF